MRFAVDTMCGRLVTYLRFCGYDTEYIEERRSDDRSDLATGFDEEGRTLITRDRTFASMADHSILLDEISLDGQLRELADAGIELSLPDRPRRCGRCNGRVERHSNQVDALPEYVPSDLDQQLYRCRACGQFFWKGSHWEHVGARLREIERS